MNVTLSSRRETWIRKKIESGQFSDVSDVVEEAFRLMEAQERFARLKTLIVEGDESYQRGEAVPLTPELLEEIKTDARRMALNGEKPDPEVWPE